VLHNLSILWNDDALENDDAVENDDANENEDALLNDDEEPALDQYVIVEDRAEPGIIRQRGKELRDKLCNEMPGRLRRERVMQIT
jgi:hypothetical protein